MGWCIAERKYAEEARARELSVVVVMGSVYFVSQVRHIQPGPGAEIHSRCKMGTTFVTSDARNRIA